MFLLAYLLLLCITVVRYCEHTLMSSFTGELQLISLGLVWCHTCNFVAGVTSVLGLRFLLSVFLTFSTPAVPNCCCSKQWRIQTFTLGGHEAPKAPSRGGVWRGGMPPFPEIFSIFYLKRRVLVDSDVLNVPVTPMRPYFHFHQYKPIRVNIYNLSTQL